MDRNPSVGIVILNYNSYNLTIDIIKNIQNVLSYENLKIAIVDNCSTNESWNKLRLFLNNYKGSLDIELIKSSENGGYSKGNNIGCSYLIKQKCEYVLIVNNDIIFTQPDTISTLVNALAENCNVGTVSPKLLKPDGSEDYPIYYKRPSFWDLTFGYLWYVSGRKKQKKGDKEVYAPRGSCMMVSSSDLIKIGFLDENTFLYYEEPILAERLSKIGKKSYHLDKLIVIHNHGQTISKNVSSKGVSKILLKSFRYYLKSYRNYSNCAIEICLLTKKITYYLRLLKTSLNISKKVK